MIAEYGMKRDDGRYQALYFQRFNSDFSWVTDDNSWLATAKEISLPDTTRVSIHVDEGFATDKNRWNVGRTYFEFITERNCR